MELYPKVEFKSRNFGDILPDRAQYLKSRAMYDVLFAV